MSSYGKNNFIKTIKEEQKAKYKEDLITYFSAFYNKTWNNLLNELLKYVNTWDNYALCVMFLNFIDSVLELEKNIKYKELLESFVLSTPDKRITTEEMEKQVISVFS